VRTVRDLLSAIQAFKEEAHQILAPYEDSVDSRVFLLRKQTLSDLSSLNVKQEAMLRQALELAQLGYNKPAIVMSWAALMDWIGNKLISEYSPQLRSRFPKAKWKSLEDLGEKVTEFDLIDLSDDRIHIRCSYPTQATVQVRDSLTCCLPFVGIADRLSPTSKTSALEVHIANREELLFLFHT